MSRTMPVVALRGMTVLPNMLIHFDVNRTMTVEAIEAAMKDDQFVFLVAQIDPEIDEPQEEDLYRVGTVAQIKQIIKLPNNVIRVMVSASKRATLEGLIELEPYLEGTICEVPEADLSHLPELELKAMLHSMRDLVEAYCSANEKVSKALLRQLMSIEKVEELIDEVAANIPLAQSEKQAILEELDCQARFDRIAVTLAEEIQLIGIKKEFQAKVKEHVDQNQKEYLLREQMKVIKEELGESNTESEAEQYEEQVSKLKASKDTKERIRKEIERYKNTSNNSAESAVIRGYIETLLALPWNKASKDNNDIIHAAEILDEAHYGMKKVKERILDFLAVRSLTKKGDSPIICLVGPPGTGKTSIARSIAKALNKEYVRICLGGVRDEAEIRGHRKTYVGAMPGRLITGLKSAGVKNPLMLLDEIDKVSSDYKGDTSSALLEVLDGEQNNTFYDHYVEIPVDLSEVFFIATANSLQTIPRPLLDRMEVIDVSSYTANEKHHIAKEHLLKKQIEKNGLKPEQIRVSDQAIRTVISSYTREAGVRNLERKLGAICRKVAREIIEKNKKSVKITEKNLEKYLGKPIYTFDLKNEKDEVGIVRGLAWTSVGGDTLSIEVNVLPGKGRIELTGQLGDVMKESAKAGISYIRSVSNQYDIGDDFFEKKDIHIHIPEGAVPKDGPSAGITMATAILSAITEKKVRADVAMTGEITLRGRVLPIGGLKEKLLAAKAAQIKLVLAPMKNEKDILDMEKEVLDGIEVKLVETMDEVIANAFVQE